MPSLHTVWCGRQCSVLWFACCYAILHHLHTSNANANCALVPPYRNVSAVCELAGAWWGSVARLHALLHVLPWIVQSCSTVTLCVHHFAGGFPHNTINFSVPALGAFSLRIICCHRNWISENAVSNSTLC